MRHEKIYCWVLLCSVYLPLAAQDKPVAPEGGKPVDETKVLLGDLYRLGGTEMKKMLPDPYSAPKAT